MVGESLPGPEPAGSNGLPAPTAPPAQASTASRGAPGGGHRTWYGEEVIVVPEYGDGPLPSGRELRRYREADPSAPRIILQEFRAESRHRRGVELEVVAGENRRADRGQVFALVIILVGLTVSGFLIHSGHDWAGGFIGGMDLLGMAALFLAGGAPARDADPARRPGPTRAAG